MRIHYIQHVPFENLGSILTWANEENGCVTGTRLYNNPELPKHNDYDWLVLWVGL